MAGFSRGLATDAMNTQYEKDTLRVQVQDWPRPSPRFTIEGSVYPTPQVASVTSWYVGSRLE